MIFSRSLLLFCLLAGLQFAPLIAQELLSCGEDASEIHNKIRPFFTPPDAYRDDYGEYPSPLLFEDGRTAGDAGEWRSRREEILGRWHSMMGEWPGLIVDPEFEILEASKRENFMQYRIRFFWTPDEETEAYLLIPEGKNKRPAVVTVFYEPESAVGLGDREYRDFAYQLARRGFVALSIGTTEATEARTYSIYYPDIDAAEVEPLSMLAYAAANAWHLLAALPEVDPERIGIVGHSFGGKWAMFAAALFDRFAAAVWSDPGIVFEHDDPNINYWEPWYLGYHPRPWRERGLITEENPARGLYPELVERGYDLTDLHALMAPRPFLVSGGSADPVHRWRALNHSIAVNRLLGYEERVAMTNRPDHSPDAESNEQIYCFFEYMLLHGGIDP